MPSEPPLAPLGPPQGPSGPPQGPLGQPPAGLPPRDTGGPGAPGGPGLLGAPGQGQTEGGLARRVRGAQLPSTEPLNLRRGTGSAGQGQGGPSGNPFSPGAVQPSDRQRAGRSSAPETPASNGDHRAADEVYGFLSSFTAGVQRGLDESSRDGEEDDERRR